ncbi:hypothetical protein [Chondromyces crocatus]|uniref:Lipoprotein n=1 Tax=Chondromyces crocatus TaxID=52 RepID=A0A0K1E9L2_CHOCO|nr:hypothetical protein [Chondromyces crocatus]AKT37544.1 uncharacterized protein CMC5_016850 [Chondromyces crocatus]
MRKTAGLWMALAAVVACTTGCGSSDEGGKGNVSFSTWGEGFIEEGIPAEEFADGWQATFDKFLVVLRNVTVADSEGNTGGEMTGSILVDHKVAGVKPVVSFNGLEAKAWNRVSFEIGPVDADTELVSASEADKALMLDAGASVHVAGQVQKGQEIKRFAWTFTTATAYTACRGEKDGKETEGVLVTNGGTDNVELTIHGDHLFYDDLQSDGAVLRFDALAAADVDGDDAISLKELAMVSLSDIQTGRYGTGSFSHIDNLESFVTALSRNLGHFRGEGECVVGNP